MRLDFEFSQTPNSPMSSGGMIPASSAWRRAYRSAVTHRPKFATNAVTTCDINETCFAHGFVCKQCFDTATWLTKTPHQPFCIWWKLWPPQVPSNGSENESSGSVAGPQGFSRTSFLVGLPKPTAILSHRFHYLSVQRIEQIDHTSHNSHHKRNTSSIETYKKKNTVDELKDYECFPNAFLSVKCGSALCLPAHSIRWFMGKCSSNRVS